MNKIKNNLQLKNWGPFLALLVLFVFSSLSSKNFLTAQNLNNVVRQSSINGVIAIGMTFVILTGGIDLSVGSVVAVSGIIAAHLSPFNPIFPIIVPFGTGLICGIINGLLVSKVKMIPFIATLATMMAVRGTAYLMITTSSVGVERTSDAFMSISKGEVFGFLPMPTIIMIVAFGLSMFILRYTSFGRNFYSVGGNEEAASMMGLKSGRVKMAAYIISGLTASLGGILLTARLGTALPIAGQGFEMKAITTVVLGGTYLTGGRGKMIGTFWATLTMGLFTNMFNMLGKISTWTENMVLGVLMLGIVILQSDVVREIFCNVGNRLKKLAGYSLD